MDSFDVVREDFNTGRINFGLAINRLIGLGWSREDAEDAILELRRDLNQQFRKERK